MCRVSPCTAREARKAIASTPRRSSMRLGLARRPNPASSRAAPPALSAPVSDAWATAGHVADHVDPRATPGRLKRYRHRGGPTAWGKGAAAGLLLRVHTAAGADPAPRSPHPLRSGRVPPGPPLVRRPAPRPGSLHRLRCKNESRPTSRGRRSPLSGGKLPMLRRLGSDRNPSLAEREPGRVSDWLRLAASVGVAAPAGPCRGDPR